MQTVSTHPQPDRQDTSSAYRRVTLSTLAGLVLTLLLSIFALGPLFYPGYLQLHTGFAPLWNLAELQTSFGSLTWRPQVGTDFDPMRGTGLLLYHLAALPPLAPSTAIKAMLGVGWLLGGVGVFLWLKRWLGKVGALIAALVYIYLPFQIMTAYVRGAWGEHIFWGMFPWAILAATYLVARRRVILLPAVALIWFLLGLTQLGLTIWAALYVLLLLLVVHFRYSLLPVLAVVGGMVLALLVNALLAPDKIFSGNPIKMADHFLYPFQLFSSYWGFGISRPGWDDGVSLQIGLAGAGLALVAIILWQSGQTSRTPVVSRSDRRLLFFTGAAVALALLQLGLPPLAGIFGLLTYPWQLMGFLGLSLAVLAGTVIWLEPKFTQLPLFAALIILIILSVYPYLEPQFLPAPRHSKPEALIGNNQLALLEHEFTVTAAGYTVGLEEGDTRLPLSVYGDPQAGDVLQLNVTWQPLKPFTRDYKIFLHLVDGNNNILAQFDGWPQGGDYPTETWSPGETIMDSYPIELPEEIPSGPYRAYLGLYDEASLERLPVAEDGSGRIILDVR